MARKYHINEIKKGEIGNISKVWEEYYEYKDAIEQGLKIMAIIELSDMIGAVKLCHPIDINIGLEFIKPKNESLYESICLYEKKMNDKSLKELLYVIYNEYKKLYSTLSNVDLFKMTIKTMEVMQNDK